MFNSCNSNKIQVNCREMHTRCVACKQFKVPNNINCISVLPPKMNKTISTFMEQHFGQGKWCDREKIALALFRCHTQFLCIHCYTMYCIGMQWQCDVMWCPKLEWRFPNNIIIVVLHRRCKRHLCAHNVYVYKI